MSLLTTLGTGLSGLKASSAGIQTATHNVVNASTAGFTRREVGFGTASPIRQNGLWFGQGVTISGIGRSADPLLFGRLVATAGQAASSASEHTALANVESLFEPVSGLGLRNAVDGLFDAFTAATADPADSGLRTEVVGAADQFARTISGIAGGLQASIADADEATAGIVVQVNADLEAVAALNRELLVAGGAFAAGDLADQRDQAIARLAGAIGATAHYEPDGSATVLVAGHAAVSGDVARTVGVRTTPGAAPELTLSVDQGTLTITDAVGGTIGGLRDGRETQESWLAELDTLAAVLGTALNAQNAAGFTRAGAAGGALFTWPTTGSAAAGLAVDPALTGDGLAFASSPLGSAGDGGNLALFIGLESAAVVGGVTAGAFASGLTSRVGSDTSLAGIRADGAAAANADVEELYANLTGVDLDEQAVQLIQYQTAYQAAAKVIQITDDMLATLMQIAR